MLILPSVGATVKRIILNESATKAKIIYDDGSSTIVSTQNTPNKQVVKKTTVTPNATVVKKKVVKKANTDSLGFKSVKTNYGELNIPSMSTPEAMQQRTPAIIEKLKRRAELRESKAEAESDAIATGSLNSMISS